MLCCTQHTGLLENNFYFLSASRSTLIIHGKRRSYSHAITCLKFRTIFNVLSGDSTVRCHLCSTGDRSSCRRLEKVDDCRLQDLAHNCHQGLPFPHPDGNRCPLRETARRRMRPLRDYDSLASWTVARRITSRSRSLPADRIGFMSKVDRQRVFHGFASWSLAEVFAEHLVSRLPHANRFGWSLQSTHCERLGQLGYPRKFQRFVEGIPHICTLWSTTVVMRRHFSSRKADLLSFG